VSLINETSAPIMPRVEELPFHGPNPEGVRRFRVEGGDLGAKWANALTGDAAWCEVTVYTDGTVGGYAGTVWPSAWPALFDFKHPHAMGGAPVTRLTALGSKLFGLTPAEPPPSKTADGLIDFILELAKSARDCKRYHYAADMFMLAVARTEGRKPEYLQAANVCRALAMGAAGVSAVQP
jgi:hypothetical protein